MSWYSFILPPQPVEEESVNVAEPSDPLRDAQTLGGNVRRLFANLTSDLETANALATEAALEAQREIDALALRKAVAAQEVDANNNLLTGLQNLGVR